MNDPNEGSSDSPGREVDDSEPLTLDNTENVEGVAQLPTGVDVSEQVSSDRGDVPPATTALPPTSPVKSGATEAPQAPATPLAGDFTGDSAVAQTPDARGLLLTPSRTPNSRQGIPRSGLGNSITSQTYLASQVPPTPGTPLSEFGSEPATPPVKRGGGGLSAGGGDGDGGGGGDDDHGDGDGDGDGDSDGDPDHALPTGDANANGNGNGAGFPATRLVPPPAEGVQVVRGSNIEVHVAEQVSGLCRRFYVVRSVGNHFESMEDSRASPLTARSASPLLPQPSTSPSIAGFR